MQSLVPSVIRFSLINLYLLANLNLIWRRSTELSNSVWFQFYKIHRWLEKKIYIILREKLQELLKSSLFFRTCPIVRWLGLGETLVVPVHSCPGDRWEKGHRRNSIYSSGRQGVEWITEGITKQRWHRQRWYATVGK